MNLVNLFWEKDNMLLQDPFLVALWNATYLGTSAKLLYVIDTFVEPSEKLLLFETEIAAFVGISKKLLLFYWKCYTSMEIHKFSTF